MPMSWANGKRNALSYGGEEAFKLEGEDVADLFELLDVWDGDSVDSCGRFTIRNLSDDTVQIRKQEESKVVVITFSDAWKLRAKIQRDAQRLRPPPSPEARRRRALGRRREEL